jgi:hypothetical protein
MHAMDGDMDGNTQLSVRLDVACKRGRLNDDADVRISSVVVTISLCVGGTTKEH